MPTPISNEDYNRLRELQIDLQRQQAQLHTDFDRIRQEFEALRSSMQRLGQTRTGNLAKAEANIQFCLTAIQRLNLGQASIGDRVQVLESHPSNAVSEFKRLPGKAQKGYLAGLGTFISGMAILVVARGGSLKIGDAEITAPALDTTAIVLALAGAGGAGYAATKQKDGSE